MLPTVLDKVGHADEIAQSVRAAFLETGVRSGARFHNTAGRTSWAGHLFAFQTKNRTVFGCSVGGGTIARTHAAGPEGAARRFFLAIVMKLSPIWVR